MSGRITAIAGSPGDPDLMFVGAATGGVWRSTNRGETWTPVFDDQPVLGVGAIAVHPQNPDLVWVGTGEGNPRNSAGVGAGVYRSLDGGDTWTLMGLEGSERIHRILLHPRDPNHLWVGSMGPAWGDGSERGVFRSKDGGETWERVLFVDEETGVSDFVADPGNPDHMLVGLWSFRRTPWSFRSGGEAGGIFETFDGGDTWERQSEAEGFPAGPTGRIGLAFSPSSPSVAYALVEAETPVLLQSQDGGRSWETVNQGANVNPRPFYYTEIHVDPLNELRLYNLHSRLQVSEDGGRSFERIGDDVHPDYQAFWTPPEDPETVWVGTDGGLFVSRDRGQTWRLIDTLPVGQFYHISVDQAIPFNVYGGMQDNGSWRGPAYLWENGGIRNYHWQEVGFGDGFNTALDPSDPSVGYSMSQGGGLRRFDLQTGERKDIRPWAPDTETLRFSWNAAFAIDPHTPGGLYYGSQFVHRSPDRGESWQIISGDLTTNDPEKQRQEESGGITIDNTGAENHTTILTIAPSELDPEVVWVGTDDGNLQLTRSGGGEWQDVGSRIRGVPDATWIPHVEASSHDVGVAYAVFDDHRRGNWEPFVYRTQDFGRSWRRIVDEDDVFGFVHTLEEDPEDPRVLYLGTEFGLYVSIDQGGSWLPWTHGIPRAPVRSIVVHPRDHDLVVGTHGRGVFVVDDVRPVREIAGQEDFGAKPLHVFEPPPAYLVSQSAVDGYHFAAQGIFSGENRPTGALITYWSHVSQSDTPVLIEVLDLNGDVVRSWSEPGGQGLQRVEWDLRGDPLMSGSEEVPRSAVEVLPDRYTLRLTQAGNLVEVPLEVRGDPRRDIEMVDRVARAQALRHAARVSATHYGASERLAEIRSIVEDLSGDEVQEEVGERIDILEAALTETSTLEDESGRLGRVRRSLSGTRDRPTEAQRLNLNRYEASVDRLADSVDRLIVGPLADLAQALESAGEQILPSLELVRRVDPEVPGASGPLP